ncbi:hypothetical protein Tco_1154486 [Tanacetum coccineum]|uniref:Uncharacterized protein n=1 Tax=Tanacetum coccineum TaxID=301880 RepID=A0ABQ5DA25_9ASTR
MRQSMVRIDYPMRREMMEMMEKIYNGNHPSVGGGGFERHDEDADEEEEERLAPAESADVVPTDEPPQTSKSASTIRQRSRDFCHDYFHHITTYLTITDPCRNALLVHAPPAHSSPPPVPLPLLPSSGCPTQIQTLRIASTQALIDAVTAALPSPPLPPLPLSLYIPPPADHRDNIPESKRVRTLNLPEVGDNYEFVSTVDAEERRQGIRDVGYDIRDTWVDPIEVVPEITHMTVEEVNTRVPELAELHEHDTQDLYTLLEDAHDSRSRISQRVDMDSQTGTTILMRDRIHSRRHYGCGIGGLSFLEEAGSLDRIELGDPSGASDPP